MPVSDVRGNSYDSVQRYVVQPFTAYTDSNDLCTTCVGNTWLGQRDTRLLATYSSGNYLNITSIEGKGKKGKGRQFV